MRIVVSGFMLLKSREILENIKFIKTFKNYQTNRNYSVAPQINFFKSNYVDFDPELRVRRPSRDSSPTLKQFIVFFRL